MAQTLSRNIIFSVIASTSLSCLAGGWEIDQPASGLGNAYAGTSAVVEDASIVFYNPAGATFLSRPQVSFPVTIINTNNDIKFKSSTVQLAPGVVFDVEGNNREDAGGWFVLPSFYLAVPFCCNQFAVGLGVNSPWALTTNYTESAMDRYLATHSRLYSVNIGPTFAWQPFCGFSIGAGVDAQYLSTDLRQQVFAFNPLVGQLPDSSIDNSGDDWAFGWNVGLIYNIRNSGTTVGASYRSRVEHTLEGDAVLAIPALNQSVPGSFSADVAMPDIATFGVVQEFCNCWAVLASATWTHWSVIDVLKANYGGAITSTPIGKSATIPLNFDDSWRYAVAVNYKPNECWKLRAGVMYDNSPVEGADVRTYRLPDNDRVWVAVGANYRINRMFNVDAGYSRLFVDNCQVNQSALLGPATFNTKADAHSSVNVFAMQLNVDLC